MHGIGLHYVLKTSERSGAARMSYSRPLRAEDESRSGESDQENSDWNEVVDKWAHIDYIMPSEKFKIALFKRYGKDIYKALEKPIIAKKQKSYSEITAKKFTDTVLKGMKKSVVAPIDDFDTAR
jgi:hypothetical protein